MAASIRRGWAAQPDSVDRCSEAKAADDLAAEVFTIAFAQRQSYDLARDCARPWLYGIATNLVGSVTGARSSAGTARWPGHTLKAMAPSDEDLVAERVERCCRRGLGAAAAQTAAPTGWPAANRMARSPTSERDCGSWARRREAGPLPAAWGPAA